MGVNLSGTITRCFRTKLRGVVLGGITEKTRFKKLAQQLSIKWSLNFLLLAEKIRGQRGYPDPGAYWFIVLILDDKYGVKYSLTWRNDQIVQAFSGAVRVIGIARPCPCLVYLELLIIGICS